MLPRPGEVFRIIPPAISRSALGCRPSWSCQENLQSEEPSRHPKLKVKPSYVPSSSPLLVSHPTEETHFGHLFVQSHSFGHDQKLTTRWGWTLECLVTSAAESAAAQAFLVELKMSDQQRRKLHMQNVFFCYTVGSVLFDLLTNYLKATVTVLLSWEMWHNFLRNRIRRN